MEEGGSEYPERVLLKLHSNLIRLARRQVIRQSQEFYGQKQYHFAFAVHRTRVIQSASNVPKSHPRMRVEGYKNAVDHIHAELSLILKLKDTKADNLDIYCVRISRSDLHTIKLSQPCKDCEQAILRKGFKSCWFSTNTGDFKKLEKK